LIGGAGGGVRATFPASTLIQDHLNHCLEDAVGAFGREQREAIDAFRPITKYL